MHRTVLLSLLLVACGDPPVGVDAGPGDDAGDALDAGPAGPTAVLYDDTSAGFFDTPFPSDRRTTSEGHPDLTGFPRARGLIAQGIELVSQERAGFSPLTAVYFRFTGPIDEASLPTLDQARDPSSRVFLIDVDPDSPDVGTRLPAYVRFRRSPSQFWPANTLTVRPVAGFEMHVGRTYAAVVLDGLQAADGAPDRRAPTP